MKNFNPRDFSWNQCQEYLTNLSNRFGIAIANLDKEESKLINVGWRYFAFDSHKVGASDLGMIDVFDRWFKPVFLNCRIKDIQEYSFEISINEWDQRKKLDSRLYYIREAKY